MTTTTSIVARLQALVDGNNRELKVEALMKALLGVAFSFLVFGFIFWCGWFFGIFLTDSLHLEAWQTGALLAGLFLIVATWSAWQRVDPLAALPPLTDRQWVLTQISLATPGLLYFSPRHATAGAAVILIGGPANVLEGWGIWASRIRADRSLLEEAADLLGACAEKCPVEQLREPVAALLLWRLELVRIDLSGDCPTLILSDKGQTVLSGPKTRERKRTRGPRKPRENGWG